MKQQLVVSRVFSFLFPLVILVATLGQTAIMYFGGRQINYGTLTLGEWQEFSLYLVYVFFPMAQLGFIISQMSQASASAGRIFEILDTESEVKDQPGAVELPDSGLPGVHRDLLLAEQVGKLRGSLLDLVLQRGALPLEVVPQPEALYEPAVVDVLKQKQAGGAHQHQDVRREEERRRRGRARPSGWACSRSRRPCSSESWRRTSASWTSCSSPSPCGRPGAFRGPSRCRRGPAYERAVPLRTSTGGGSRNLQAVLAGPATKPGSRPPTRPGAAAGTAPPAESGGHRTRNTLVGGAGAVGLFILGKLKFLGLLAGVLKLNTLATMILSIGLYAIEWGVPFAVGFVLLIFVHECGHAIVLRREGIPVATEKRVTYHDPCDLGRHLGIYEEPREVIRQITPQFVEMVHNRADALCCGAGGGVRGAYPKNSIAIARRRLQEAEEVGAEIILTECNSCVHNLMNAKRSRQNFMIRTTAQFINELMEEASSVGR